MELHKIKNLLEEYFEGRTTLEEEKILKNYFSQSDVSPDLEKYKPIFKVFENEKAIKSEKEFHIIDEKPLKMRPWWYSVAALLVLALAVGGFYLSQPQISNQEKEALAAFEKSKEAMQLLSQNFNKGTEQLTYVNQFTITKNKYLK